MKLNHNSISARLYRWFYLTDNMPTNLCPYFWKLVLMYVLIIPAALLYMPGHIMKSHTTEMAERAAVGLVGWVLTFAAFCAIFPITYFFYGWFPEKTFALAFQQVGILVWCVLLLLGGAYGWIELHTRRQHRKYMKRLEFIWDADGNFVKNPNYEPYEKKPNIIIEFIKASYHKYCPRIEWNNKNK